MLKNKNNLGVKIALGTAAFVVSTWVSAYFSMQSANAQSFGFGTVTASTASWYKTTGTSDIYYKDGNVGIGTQSPGTALEVQATAVDNVAVSPNPPTPGSVESIATFKVSDDSTAKLEIMNATNADDIFIPYIRGTGSSDKIPLYLSGVVTTDTGTNPAVMISGRLAGAALVTRPVLKVSNYSTDLMTVAANGSVTASSFLYASDERLKTDLKPLAGALEKIEKIGGYRFKWKDGRDDEIHLGVLAQEVEKQFPEAVKTNADGYKAVDYPALVPVLFEAIREQQAQINELKEKLAQ